MGSQLPLKGTQPPVFGSWLLWPNGWMDEDATWYRSRPRPGHIVLDGVPALRERGTAAPLFLAHVYCGHVAYLSYGTVELLYSQILSRLWMCGMTGLLYSLLILCFNAVNCNHCFQSSIYMRKCGLTNEVKRCFILRWLCYFMERRIIVWSGSCYNWILKL